MAESGQQPTAGSELDTLVNVIFDMMSNMKIRKIDRGFESESERLYFNKLLRDEHSESLPPEVNAERMRKFMSRLQKTVQDASNAAAADKPDRSDTHGEVEGELPGGVYRGASADARVCTEREETKAKCEAIRALGLVYIREQLAGGGAALRRVAYRSPCDAYADSLGVQAKTLDDCQCYINASQ
jgi:hypothetical protein